MYPVTDYEFDSAAMIDNAKGYFLEAEGMRWFYDHYARTPADFDDPRFSPLRASDLSGLAPRGRGHRRVRPAARPGRGVRQAPARRAGVPTEVVRADGLIHGFFGMHEFMPPGRDAWDISIAALREAFGTT